MKFTFKINRETGLAAVMNPPSCDIKVGGRVVGCVCRELRSPMYKIHFSIVDRATEARWRNIVLAADFGSIDDAKVFLKDHSDELFKKFEFR